MNPAVLEGSLGYLVPLAIWGQNPIGNEMPAL